MVEWAVGIGIYVVSVIVCGGGEHGSQPEHPPVALSCHVVLSHDGDIQKREFIVVAAIFATERRLRYVSECHAGHHREFFAEIAIQPVANACRESGIAAAIGFVDQQTSGEVDVVLPLFGLCIGCKYSCEQEHEKKSFFHCCYALIPQHYYKLNFLST